MTISCKISVILPVYNAEEYLKESIESILSQTFTNFEFIILNDGSTDQSRNIIRAYNDNRIKFVENKINMGLIKTLNLGLNLAEGKYIARMDADDIALPNRLETQVNFMEKNIDIVACGSWIQYFGKSNKKRRYPLTDKEIRSHFLFRSPLAHPSVIMKASPFKGKNPVRYNANYLHAEDYKLWFDLMAHGRLANLPFYLLKYRVSAEQITKKHGNQCDKTSRKIRREFIDLIFQKNNYPKTPKKITLGDIKLLESTSLKNCDCKIKNMVIHCYYLSLQEYSFKSLLHFIISFRYLSYPYNTKEFLRVLNNHLSKKRDKWL
jgi:glycosyltransferase involved in cell wall biosynthesis